MTNDFLYEVKGFLLNAPNDKYEKYLGENCKQRNV